MPRQYHTNYGLSASKRSEKSLIDQLVTLFPLGDPEYFRHCVSYYETNHIERITEKIFEMGGYYPQLAYQVDINDNNNNNSLATEQHQRWNAALYTLATKLFPDTDIDYLRRIISQHTHSIVEQATTQILADPCVPERLEYGQLSRHDMFKSESYKAQALEQLVLDYPQIWKSSICAVLAENNWDYINSFDQLSEMGSGGFWRSIRNFFVHWSLPKAGSSSSSSSTTSSSLHQRQHYMDNTFTQELDLLRKRQLDQQSAKDQVVAQEINTQEYDKHHQSITCGCCFGDYPFEALVFCSQGNHPFCHDCITRFMMEGLFGQGGLRGVDRIPCISSEETCHGCLPTMVLQQVLSNDVWKAYESSLFEVNISRQSWGLVQCAACSYCELDESIRPMQQILDKTARFISIARWVMVLLLLLIILMLGRMVNGKLITLLLLFTLGIPLIISQHQWDLQTDLQIAYNRIVHQRRGYAFQCRHPSCGKLTCLQCMHIIRGIHSCYENERDGLRLYVEKAMADAVKLSCMQSVISKIRWMQQNCMQVWLCHVLYLSQRYWKRILFSFL
ncbi:uncharacterized protein BX664DRAFT_129589 [Halteromyces radiatus]|uniref:uncharacterized protein n=1 Tax=Halteromyces radiatus TaxID=101107 RepID=UPI00221EEA3C|nr:uncharacterized protein BX664DRAFT_129589 [Halteromyces radiatus]KAI8089215.1 hypothetical protein BX664DRAFT_129589 [Halteromyces radiatus]